MIQKIWKNTIWETSDPETDEYTKTKGKFNDDFNDSLTAYFESPGYILDAETLKGHRTDFLKRIRELSDYPCLLYTSFCFVFSGCSNTLQNRPALFPLFLLHLPRSHAM